jgi:peptide/nickel transport system substrate-binding protein
VSPALAQKTRRIGLAEDPDVLDPTLARTLVGRVVFASLCDKLFDLDEKLAIVPQLATEYKWAADNKSLTIKIRPGVTFHDGEKLDAEAVKFNIERHKTLTGSNRRGELAPVTSVDVLDSSTVRLNLTGPSRRSDRPHRPRRDDGLPKAAKAAATSSRTTRCARALQVRRTRRPGPHRRGALPQLLEQGADHFDKVVYLPIVDSTFASRT